MKSRRFSLASAFVLSLSLALAFVLSSLMKTGTAAPAPTEATPFRGQIVAVTTDDNYGVCLCHAQVRQLGGRSFLVGKGSDDDNPVNWTKGRMTWVPMSRIVQMVEFGSEEDMKKAREEYRKKNPVPPQAPAIPPLVPADGSPAVPGPVPPYALSQDPSEE